MWIQYLKAIVTMMPKASEIFKQYKIDFCCGGNRKFSEVVKEQKLDEGKVLKKLNEAFEESSGTRLYMNYAKKNAD